VHDLFLNETANYAHVFLPGSTFLEKDGTFINAERRINLVRKVMEPRARFADWEVTQEIARAMGLAWNYTHPSQIMDEIARTTPTFAGVSFAKLAEGSVQWPCTTRRRRHAVIHIGGFVRGMGGFASPDVCRPTSVGPRFPLLLTTGRILSQYNVGAQTRRTENVVWHHEDVLEIHPHDAEERGVRDGDLVRLASRSGQTTLRARITDRVAPGVVYTTFHHPATQANVVTSDYSDWATNCPEYKVTAVQVRHRMGRAMAGRVSRLICGRGPASRGRPSQVRAVTAGAGEVPSPCGRGGKGSGVRRCPTPNPPPRGHSGHTQMNPAAGPQRCALRR
jgi:formate dehydrogenase major subunit